MCVWASGASLKPMWARFGAHPLGICVVHTRCLRYARAVDGCTPFQIAVRYGFPEMMKALFDSGGGTTPSPFLPETLDYAVAFLSLSLCVYRVWVALRGL